MLFIDEIHQVPRPVLETLYQAMADGHIDLTLHAGAQARCVRLALPAFSLLAATTEEGDLPAALCSRFGLREVLGFYEAEDLAAVATAEADKQGFALEPAAAARLAAHARGTPREALRLLNRILDDVARKGRTRLTEPEASEALTRLGYDREGLDPGEQRYLELLRASPAPVPLGRLARMLGQSARTLTAYVEPHLCRLGLVQVTARGRMAVHRPRLPHALGARS